jgi:hypothetical protein
MQVREKAPILWDGFPCIPLRTESSGSFCHYNEVPLISHNCSIAVSLYIFSFPLLHCVCKMEELIHIPEPHSWAVNLAIYDSI